VGPPPDCSALADPAGCRVGVCSQAAQACVAANAPAGAVCDPGGCSAGGAFLYTACDDSGQCADSPAPLACSGIDACSPGLCLPEHGCEVQTHYGAPCAAIAGTWRGFAVAVQGAAGLDRLTASARWQLAITAAGGGFEAAVTDLSAPGSPPRPPWRCPSRQPAR
jgi:hypothetical protein